MSKTKFIIALLVIIAGILAVFFALSNENTLVMHPRGIIAQGELELIFTNYLLMFIIVIPTLIALFVIAWKYHESNVKAEHDSEYSHSVFGEVVLWIIPSIIIAIMMVHAWYKTHELDPYKPLESSNKTLKIQVIALDWKWLFIYPEQGIAAVNYFEFPENTPIHLELSADGAPMNGFWLPQLAGQIYAMPGMATQLHLMASERGEYRGRAAEINGEGLADMTFIAKATTPSEFDAWVGEVKKSPLKLTSEAYDKLRERSIKHPVVLYSDVEGELFNKIIMKYMESHGK